MRIIKYEKKYRDDLIFMVLAAKNAPGRVPGLNDIYSDLYVRRKYINAITI